MCNVGCRYRTLVQQSRVNKVCPVSDSRCAAIWNVLLVGTYALSDLANGESV